MAAQETYVSLHRHNKVAQAARPLLCRVLQITELVRDCLQQRDANCTILPAPPETCDQDATATILQARPRMPLHNVSSASASCAPEELLCQGSVRVHPLYGCASTPA